MVQQIQEGYKLNWLLTASLFWSKAFHPTLFGRWMHLPQFSSKFPMLSYMDVDLIDLDPWQFFSDSLVLTKVTVWNELSKLKYTSFAHVHDILYYFLCRFHIFWRLEEVSYIKSLLEHFWCIFSKYWLFVYGSSSKTIVRTTCRWCRTKYMWKYHKILWLFKQVIIIPPQKF